MDIFTKYISSQFKNPRGIGGGIISLLQNAINRKMYKEAVSCVREEGRSTNLNNVLDVGYGNGHLLEMIYRKQKIDLFGIDISDDAREMAEKRNRLAANNGQLHLAVGDVCHLEFSDASFSAVTSINTVYFWEDTVQGLKEIRRVLKEGAAFYNILYTKEYLDKVRYTAIGYKKFLPEELIMAGKEAGFQNVEIRDIVKGSSFVVIYTK